MVKNAIVLFFLLSLPSCSMDGKIESLKNLGTKEFSSIIWMSADELERGKMIHDFLKKNSPITDKTRGFIIEQLGPNTGYHLYDSFPAYYVGPPPPNNHVKAYLIAFTIDHASEKITNIFIDPKIK
jgi:hypothetical protein